ncbi:unnamed protein product [Prunus armeniaca]
MLPRLLKESGYIGDGLLRVGAEQKLAYLTRQVNKARYRKEKQRICAQRRKHTSEDLHMTEEDATYESLSIHKGGDNQG